MRRRIRKNICPLLVANWLELSTAILDITKQLIKKACKLAPESSEYLFEQGYQQQLTGGQSVLRVVPLLVAWGLLGLAPQVTLRCLLALV